MLLSFMLLLIAIKPLFLDNQQDLDEAEFKLTVLDVGQGSAAVLRTQNHALVFDTGARFSDRLDAGSGVVIPYLRMQNITQLDHLVVSHGDADHIGGAQAIIDEYPLTKVIGQDIENLDADYKRLCVAGLKWQWDGVVFTFLSPAKDGVLALADSKRNNRSCVLKVSSIYGSVLFTGDIEKKTEKWLLNKYSTELVSDILLVPHHGSLSSSSQPFIRQVDPEIAVISAGYKNRYRLPNKQVMARYEYLNQPVLLTSSSGAVSIEVKADEVPEIEQYRLQAGKYWHHIVR